MYSIICRPFNPSDSGPAACILSGLGRDPADQRPTQHTSSDREVISGTRSGLDRVLDLVLQTGLDRVLDLVLQKGSDQVLDLGKL